MRFTRLQMEMIQLHNLLHTRAKSITADTTLRDVAIDAYGRAGTVMIESYLIESARSSYIFSIQLVNWYVTSTRNFGRS